MCTVLAAPYAFLRYVVVTVSPDVASFVDNDGSQSEIVIASFSEHGAREPGTHDLEGLPQMGKLTDRRSSRRSRLTICPYENPLCFRGKQRGQKVALIETYLITVYLRTKVINKVMQACMYACVSTQKHYAGKMPWKSNANLLSIERTYQGLTLISHHKLSSKYTCNSKSNVF